MRVGPPAWHGPVLSDGVTPSTEAHAGNGAGHKHHKHHQQTEQQVQEGVEEGAGKHGKNKMFYYVNTCMYYLYQYFILISCGPVVVSTIVMNDYAVVPWVFMSMKPLWQTHM